MSNLTPVPAADPTPHHESGGGGQEPDFVELESASGGEEVEFVDWGTTADPAFVLAADRDEGITALSMMAIVPRDLPKLEFYPSGLRSLKFHPPHSAVAIQSAPAVVGVGHPPANASSLDGLPEDVGEMGAE